VSDGISRTEWRWAISVSLAVVAFSTLPYAAGYLAQTSDLHFAGGVFDLEDYHSYLARMWQGYRGEWQFRSLFTPEAHEGAYFQPFHIALGHLARLTGLGLPLTYQVARVVFGLLMLLLVYRFIARFVAPVHTRRVAFLLATTSSGVGWLVEMVHSTLPGGISPVDFWLIDAYTFFSLFVVPHFSVAIALLLSIYGVLLRLAGAAGEASPGTSLRLQDGAAVVLLSWGLGLIHPYALLLVDLVPALYLAWRVVAERRLPVRLLVALVLMGLAQVPLLLYDYRVFSTSPIFRAWAAQNTTVSPPPMHYLLGYGVVAFLAAWGVRPALRSCSRCPFLLLWIVAAFGLAYLPWGLQRRFVEGVHVGLCVLAGYGLVDGLMPVLARPLGRMARLLRYSPRRLRWLAQALILVLAALSNLYLVSGYTLAASARHPALFRTADEVAAVEWLHSHSEWDETVLAAYETGNWIAGTIGHRVVLGHWAETADCEVKRTQVAAFYGAGTTGAERRGLLDQWGVRYVYVGPLEQALGGLDPAIASDLELAFSRGDVEMYRVREQP
jgi:hypothetical protein